MEREGIDYLSTDKEKCGSLPFVVVVAVIVFVVLSYMCVISRRQRGRNTHTRAGTMYKKQGGVVDCVVLFRPLVIVVRSFVGVELERV
jgi:heme/copper-type cytochrome/quinol oxidase subunit 2